MPRKFEVKNDETLREQVPSNSNIKVRNSNTTYKSNPYDEKRTINWHIYKISLKDNVIESCFIYEKTESRKGFSTNGYLFLYIRMNTNNAERQKCLWMNTQNARFSLIIPYHTKKSYHTHLSHKIG